MLENNGKITANEGQFASLKLPTLINFYQFTGIPKYEDSQERKKLLEDTENWQKKENIKADVIAGRGVAFIAILVIGCILYFSKLHPTLFVILIILLLAGNFFLWSKTHSILEKHKNDPPEEQPITKKQGHIYYLEMVLQKIQTEYLNNFRGFEFDNWGFLFYSKLGCACIDLISGQMVLYAKENIKDVLLEHVNLGTTTTGNAYTSGGMNRGIIFDFHYTQYSDTGIDTDSVQHYEWRLDILTDFLEHPKLSFRFADNTKGEDEAKIIYGILKP